jgi:hypothetical protein
VNVATIAAAISERVPTAAPVYENAAVRLAVGLFVVGVLVSAAVKLAALFGPRRRR